MELSGTVEMSQPKRDGGLNGHARVRLYCPCNKYGPCDAFTQTELLTCHYCKLQQHAACFGVVRHLASRVTEHCCSKCYDVDTTRTPTDTKLVSLTMRKRESLCILRRTLAVFGSRNHWSPGLDGQIRYI
ncbi:uncharacterized protein LOC123704998 [Colias croceus]|uniref:uncharacterized protein LOC123704998 n=1 Tax=Colias crocea TaxID=72248 RepID=UPI001E27FBC7|nr:uncharacterized protein LOC123704998 [Colias croceus]